MTAPRVSAPAKTAMTTVRRPVRARRVGAGSGVGRLMSSMVTVVPRSAGACGGWRASAVMLRRCGGVDEGL